MIEIAIIQELRDAATATIDRTVDRRWSTGEVTAKHWNAGAELIVEPLTSWTTIVRDRDRYANFWNCTGQVGIKHIEWLICILELFEFEGPQANGECKSQSKCLHQIFICLMLYLRFQFIESLINCQEFNICQELKLP